MTAAGGRSVLVTGARGYLGGRICRTIAATPGWVLAGASRRGGPPRGWPGGRFVQLDLPAGPGVLAGSFAGIDTLVHLASPDRAALETDPPGADGATRASAAVLEAAAAAGVRRFIYLSTAHVYGTPLAGRIDEQSPTRPAGPYAMVHKAVEDIVLAAHRAARIDGIVLRLSNAIGAPAWSEIAQWSTVGNDLCRQAVTEGTLRLRSGGQWRDFITVGDVAAAVVHMIDLPRDRLTDGLFNLGGAMPLRVIDVAERVADRAAALFGRRPEIICPSAEPAPPVDYRIDKVLATGFRLTGCLADELDATLRLCAESFPTAAVFGARRPTR